MRTNPIRPDAAVGRLSMPVTEVDVVIITALEEEREAVRAKLRGCRPVPPTGDDVRVY